MYLRFTGIAEKEVLLRSPIPSCLYPASRTGMRTDIAPCSRTSKKALPSRGARKAFGDAATAGTSMRATKHQSNALHASILGHTISS